MQSSASFVFELVSKTDNRLCFGHSDGLFSQEKLQCLIDYVSTNQLYPRVLFSLAKEFI